MKYFFSFFIFLFFQCAFAQTDVKVVIKNIKKFEGNLSIEFYRNIENYTKGQNAFKKMYVPIKDLDQYETVFKNVDETYYAVKVFVDTNGNKKLDRNLIGVRQEPYGYSGETDPVLREPTFDEAKVLTSKKDNTITIVLKNNKGDND
jgi:uncharacterized protein (DUF2141 family)